MRTGLPYPNTKEKTTSKKMVWPDVKTLLPSSDRNRLFYPDIAFESAYTFDEIRSRLRADQHTYCSCAGYSISMIDVHQFPYSEGRLAEGYFYRAPPSLGVHYTKCIRLFDIIQFRNETDNTLFWLLSTINKELNSNGCNLYTQEATPDFSLAQPLVAVLERIVTAIVI